MTVFESALADTLKKTLKNIVDDDTDGVAASMDLHDWMDEQDTDEAYVDDLEMGGPGLAVEKYEGQPLTPGSIREGALYRYLMRTFGLVIGITEEAMEDCKYEQAIKLSRRCKRAMYKTMDIDATNILNRMFNTSYVGGDGVCLGSASHTLPNGGTYSNIMSTPFSPSVAAVEIARANVRQMPGHDGVVEGYQLKTVLCPVQQEGVWERICYSEMDPKAGNYAAINTVKQRIKLGMKALRYWTGSTTNYAFLTDASDGKPRFYTRRAPRSRQWTENSHEVMFSSISARFGRGWSEPRGVYGVNA